LWQLPFNSIQDQLPDEIETPF